MDFAFNDEQREIQASAKRLMEEKATLDRVVELADSDAGHSTEDYAKLAVVVTNPTVIAALDLCAASPGEWIPLRDVEARAERTRYQARGDLAGLTMMLKHRFGRANWPIEPGWEAGGPGQIYYRMSHDQAAMWLAAQQVDPAPG